MELSSSDKERIQHQYDAFVTHCIIPKLCVLLPDFFTFLCLKWYHKGTVAKLTKK